jgi:hypothetical protein
MDLEPRQLGFVPSMIFGGIAGSLSVAGSEVSAAGFSSASLAAASLAAAYLAAVSLAAAFAARFAVRDEIVRADLQIGEVEKTESLHGSDAVERRRGVSR